MSPSPLSSKPCTKGGTTSRRWIAVALAVALVGFVGSTFAKTAKPVANAKPVAARSVDDSSAQTTTLSETRAPGHPNAPVNDDCGGAVVIPDGPYPVLTAPVNAIDSTPDGVDDNGLTAACNSAGVDRTVWYKFTPSVSTAYTFTTCPAQGATGNNVLDTVIALFSSSDGTCGGILTSVACNDTASPACSTPGDMSTMTALLTAGQTYYAVAGHWLLDGNFSASNSTYVFSVVRSNAPANDTCAGAINLPLNRLITGTTTASNNDYQTPATAACFAGLAGTQTPTTSPGRDVTFTFTAPSAGNYSIRYFDAFGVGDLVGDDMVLYASNSCPAGGGTVSCLQGSNHVPGRGGNTITGPSSNTGEEITCLPLSAGQQIYVFLDSASTGASSTPGQYGMEVTPCTREVEPNDTIATATPYVNALCGEQEGSSTVSPSYHCVVGPNAGNACVLTNPSTADFPPANANICNPAPNPANVGLCFPDSVCETGPNLGQACVPRCVGGPTPGIACGNSNQCGTGGVCATSGQCGICTAGPGTGNACIQNSNCGTGGVCNVGVCGRTGNEGDVDYWSIGAPAANSKVFATAVGAAANSMDYRLRVVNPANTLQFDDDDAIGLFGSLSPVIAGAKTDGTSTYVRVSSTSPFVSDPYRLYAVVEPPTNVAQPENGEGFDGNYGWPADGLFDDAINNVSGGPNGWIKGTIFTTNNGGTAISGDQDCYKLWANKGDDLIWFGDSNPERNGLGTFDPNQGGTIPQIIVYAADSPGISNFVFRVDTNGAIRNTAGTGAGGAFTPGPVGLTPRISSFFQHWRAGYTGAYEVCFFSWYNTNANGTMIQAAGPFPSPYTVSLTNNCGPVPAYASTTDLQITKTGPAGPIATGSQATYTITITNVGNEVALEPTLDDQLPSNLRYLSATIDDGFGGNNTACLSVPDPGSAGDLNCTTMSIAPGDSVTYTLTVQVGDCLPGGTDVVNTATVSSSVTTDSNPANNSASWTFGTTTSNDCTQLICDSNGCQTDNCYLPGTCVNNACVALPRNCDDSNACTADSCNPTQSGPNGGCINDPSPGQQCDDGNACTGDATGHDSCDPAIGCVFAPAPLGTSCNDFFNCTDNDICDGNGNCAGTSVCDDHNVCTDDYADEFNNCACSNFPNLGPCDDGNACTTGDTCDDQAVCQPGTGALDCDDHDACTLDTCNSASGCVHTAITCDDGNACTIDSCDPADGCHYVDNSAACNDNNACTNDSCNPASGCVYTNNTNSCDDGNACTSGDACSGGSCHSGAPVVCNDNNSCTDDACDPSSGCYYTNNTNACDDGNACTTGDICGGGSCHSGAPTVCQASDQCHVAGTCDPGTGSCSNPNAPNGTTCDDGNPATTGDSCTAGVCSGSTGPACPDTATPKTAGYYKKLCGNGNHGGDSITNADAACVAGLTATFSGRVSTAADICSVLATGGGQDACSKDEDELMALALNICRNRVCQAMEIDSNCGRNTKTVGQSLSVADGIFADPNRFTNSCNVGDCLGREINNGRALKLKSLNLSMQAGSVKIAWAPVRLNDGTATPSGYTIWRRAAGSNAEFKQIGTSAVPMFVDKTAKNPLAFEYDVRPVAAQ